MGTVLNNYSLSLYCFIQSLFDRFIFSQKELKNSDKTQKNAFWIIILFIILGVLAIATLIWACKYYGHGSKFAGEFSFMGLDIKIKCG